MYIIKNLYLTITITILFLSTDINSINIGRFWNYFHANSLIGLQKIIENCFFENDNKDLWFNYIVPILEIKIIFIVSFTMLALYFYLFKKKKN